MQSTGFIDPVALQLGPFNIRWYGLVFVTGILAGLWASTREARRRGLNPEFVSDIGMVIVPAGILGARLYEVFVLQWSYYREHLGEIFAIWKGGLAIHGGVLAALLLGGLYVWRKRQPFWLWADIISPGLILAQAVGRWGNFFNQEAYGGPAPQWVVQLLPGFIRAGMTINGVIMHPTFLYESLWNLASFGVIYVVQRKRLPAGIIFCLYLILYNAGRFLIESIRTDSSFVLGTIRVAQLMAILQILAGIGFSIWLVRRHERTHPDPAQPLS